MEKRARDFLGDSAKGRWEGVVREQEVDTILIHITVCVCAVRTEQPFVGC